MASYFAGQPHGQQNDNYGGYQQQSSYHHQQHQHQQQQQGYQQQQSGYQQSNYGQQQNNYQQFNNNMGHPNPMSHQTRRHARTASHTSYGSHGSHTSMFECDLNAKDFFGSAPADSSNSNSGGVNNNTGTDKIANAGMNNAGNALASTANEDFSSYNTNQTNEDFSSYNQSNEEVYYEGVALKTALSAFGSVASAVGGIANNVSSNVRGVVGHGSNPPGVQGDTGSGSVGGMMNALTPARLANNMSNWRGKLAEVVAPQPGVQQQIGQQHQHASPQMSGQQPPVIQRQDSLPQGYSEFADQASLNSHQLQGQQSADYVFGATPAEQTNNMAMQHGYSGQTQQPQFNQHSSAEDIFTSPPVNPSPNSTSSWQLVNDPGVSSTQPPQTPLMQQSSMPGHRPPLSHQLSALEKARHDSTTFQYADPLVGNISDAPPADTAASLANEVVLPPPTEGVNSMEIGKYTNVAASGETHDLSTISTPMASMDDPFTTHFQAVSAGSTSQSPSIPVAPTTPSNALPTQSTFTSTPASSTPASTKPASGPLNKPIPAAPRSGNRRMQLNLPKKANLPLPPPMPRKKPSLPTPSHSVANSSLGGDSRSSHLGLASHFKKPPPMEVSASPRLSTPQHRIYSPRVDSSKMSDLSPLPSPRIDWKGASADAVPAAPLDESIMMNEKPVEEPLVASGETNLPKEATGQHHPAADVHKDRQDAAPPINSEVSPHMIQHQESEKIENIVASAVVRGTLFGAVESVVQSAAKNLPPAPPPTFSQEPSQHVSFSADAPPIYHSQFPETESSCVTECDVLSDYQSFVKDEDVPPIKKGSGHDQNQSMLPVASIERSREAEFPGVLADSSMVAECDDHSDYQGDLKDEVGEVATEQAGESSKSIALPEGWVESVDEASGEVYYYNTITNVSSWTVPINSSLDPNAISARPDEHFNAEAVYDEHLNEIENLPIKSSDGDISQQLVDHRSVTEQTSTAPADVIAEENVANDTSVSVAPDHVLPSGWIEMYEEGSGMAYYYNKVSGESRWEKPSIDAVSVEVLDDRPQISDSLDHPQSEAISAEMPDEGDPELEEEVPKVADGNDVDEQATSTKKEVSNENLSPKSSLHVSPLPDGWLEAKDPTNGKPFFVCLATGVSSYERPILQVDSGSAPAVGSSASAEINPDESVGDISGAPLNKCNQLEVTEQDNIGEKDIIAEEEFIPPLPTGWIETIDQQTGDKYYYNEITNASRWDRPVESVSDMVGPGESEPGSTPESAGATGETDTAVNDDAVDLATTELEAEHRSPSPNNENIATLDDLTALPAGWHKEIDPQSGNTYYYHELTCDTVWDRPEKEQGESKDEAQGDTRVDFLDTANASDMSSPSRAAELPHNEISQGDEVNAPHSKAESAAASAEIPTEEENEVSDSPEHNISIEDKTKVLPEGWQELVDPTTGNLYYYNEVTGLSSWTLPEQEHGTDEAKVDSSGHSNSNQIESNKDLPADTEVDFTAAVSGHVEKPEDDFRPLDSTVMLPEGWTNVDPASEWDRPASDAEPFAGQIEVVNEIITEAPVEPTATPTGTLAKESAPISPAEHETLPEDAAKVQSESTTEVDATELPCESNLLPDGWLQTFDETTGKPYYYNEQTGAVSWTLPYKQDSTIQGESTSDAEPFAGQTDVVPENEIKTEAPVELTAPISPAENESLPKDAAKVQSESTTEVDATDVSGKSNFLPDGWLQTFDETTGKPYYYNEQTGDVSWTLPNKQNDTTQDDNPMPSNISEDVVEEEIQESALTPELIDDSTKPMPEQDVRSELNLPVGWMSVTDESSGKTYYYHETSGQTSWDPPKEDAAQLQVGSKEADTSTARLVRSGERSKPAHAIAIFGFGGRLCVMIPQVAKSLSGSTLPLSNEGVKTMRRGPVVIHQLRNLIPRDHKYSIPAQLSLPMIQSRDDDVISFLNEKSAVADSLIWNVVRIAAQNGGRLKDDFSAVVDLLLAEENSGSDSKKSLPQSPKVPTSSYVNTDLEEIQKLLMRGNRDEAVDEALENKNYALALLIASMSGFDTYQIVAQRFADEVLSPGSPLHTVALMLSKNLKIPSSEDLADPDSESFWCDDIYCDLGSMWKYHLASILSNHKEGWNKIVLTLGDRLTQLEHFDAAHVCYLMCGCPIGTNWNLPTRLLLLGCDHNVPLHSELMTPESIESFLCTEAFEWARRKGNRRTCLQSLQTFKLRYAELLADFGYVELAREYVVSIRQLTGIGLDNSTPHAIPASGNGLVPVFPDDFVDRLYRFEDRLCVLTGAKLSCKRKASEEHRKSTLAAITGGLGSVFSRTLSSDGTEKTKKAVQQQEITLDEPSSENEFMDMIETKPSKSLAPDSKPNDNPPGAKKDQIKSHKEATFVNSKSITSEANKPPKSSETKVKPQLFTPFSAVKPTEEHKTDSISGHTGDFPPASAPPTLGDDAADKVIEDKRNEPKQKMPSPTSTPNPKHNDKKAPSSEPPRSGGWLSKLLGRDSESKAKVADVGEDMQAYYDEKLKRWIFPGDDPAEVAKPLAPPPIMTPKTSDGAAVVSSTLAASNDPLAALMAPPSRAMSLKKSGPPPSRRYADPLSSMGNVSSTPMTGLPPISSKNVPHSPMRTDAAAPKFAVFQPKPSDSTTKSNEQEN